MKKLIIREAEDSDVESMKEIWKEFIDHHKAVNSFFSRVDDAHEKFGEFVLSNIRNKEKWIVLTALYDEKIAGYCMAFREEYPPVYENPRYGYIMDMAVSGKYRRNYIGTKLYSRVADWFKEKGLSRIELHAVAANSLGLKFWRKMGFEEFMIRMSKEIQA